MQNPSSDKIYQKKAVNLPRYQDYCLSNIPNTILSLFKKTNNTALPSDTLPGQEFNHVILILIDGLGYYSYLENQNLFDFFQDQSLTTPVTTLFPSTTAACLTTLSTGVLPCQHSLFEWRIYAPLLQQIIKPLPFCPEDCKQNDSLIESQYSPQELLFDQETIYEKLKKINVESFSFSHRSYWQSVFSKLTRSGSQRIPFYDLSELFVKLTQTTNNIRKKYQKTYTYAYIDYLDTVSHHHGPQSGYAQAELLQIMTMMEKLFWNKINQEDFQDTLVLITADHGQIPTDSQNTILLNQFSQLNDMLQKTPQGKPILSVGGPRDVFLHIQADKITTAQQYLSKKLADKADVFTTKEIIKKGWFSHEKPQKKFLDSLGDIVIMPKENNLIWYKREGHESNIKRGHHGGLSWQEMYVPLIAATPGRSLT